MLSKDLVFKNKRTIADPQSQWLKTVFKKYIMDILNSKFAKEDEIINSDYLLKNFEELFKSTEHFNSFFISMLELFDLGKNIFNKKMNNKFLNAKNFVFFKIIYCKTSEKKNSIV